MRLQGAVIVLVFKCLIVLICVLNSVDSRYLIWPLKKVCVWVRDWGPFLVFSAPWFTFLICKVSSSARRPCLAEISRLHHPFFAHIVLYLGTRFHKCCVQLSSESHYGRKYFTSQSTDSDLHKLCTITHFVSYHHKMALNLRTTRRLWGQSMRIKLLNRAARRG